MHLFHTSRIARFFSRSFPNNPEIHLGQHYIVDIPSFVKKTDQQAPIAVNIGRCTIRKAGPVRKLLSCPAGRSNVEHGFLGRRKARASRRGFHKITTVAYSTRRLPYFFCVGKDIETKFVIVLIIVAANGRLSLHVP